MEIAKKLGSVANELTILVDVKLKRNGEQEKTNGNESDKYLTRKELTAECQLIYQELMILTYGQYPYITP